MNKDAQADTFARSCQHWSEDGRAGMEAFYRLATKDYRLLVEQLDWLQVFQSLSGKSGADLRLLDVACGSGQFPAALLKHGRLQDDDTLTVRYSLLDPSDFSIRTAREKLASPFESTAEHCCTIQDFEPRVPGYSIVWATHALYCVPQRELGVATDRMLESLDSTGLGFIAHASQDSHYVKFHDLYLESQRDESVEPYSTGEQLIEALQAKVDREHLQFWAIDYEGQLELDDRETAEGYLQRCLFDDTLDLDQMLADQHLGAYLNECMDVEQNLWRFRQRVWLIFFGAFAKSIDQLRRT